MEILDQNEFSYKKIIPEEQSGFIMTFMTKISRGKVSSTKQATGILSVLVILCILGTLYILLIHPMLRGPGAGIEAAASHHND